MNHLQNLSEWLYISNSSSTDDLEPLTTLIAPLAIMPRLKIEHGFNLKNTTTIIADKYYTGRSICMSKMQK